MVQESLACGEQHIVHSRCHNLGERTVSLHAQRLVRTVIAHDIHLCRGQFIAFHLIHPSRDGLYNLRLLEAVYMVPSPAVTSV